MTAVRNVYLQRKDSVRQPGSSSGTEMSAVYVQTARGIGVGNVADKDRVFFFPFSLLYFRRVL